MKKALLLFLLVSSTVLAGPPRKGKKKEQWIDIGLRLSPSATGLFNNVSAFDSDIKYGFPFGYDGGLKIGYNIGGAFAFAIEGHYAAFSQKISGKSSLGYDWKHSIAMSYIEIPFLIRLRNEKKWKYFEFGMKYGMLQTAKGSYSSNPVTGTSYTNSDLKSKVSKDNLAVVIGWGRDVLGTKGMLISTGLRLAYGITDIVSESKANKQNYPYPMFAGDLSNTKQTSYSPTNLVTLGIQINIEYDLGSFMTSSCKRNHRFVLFQNR